VLLVAMLGSSSGWLGMEEREEKKGLGEHLGCLVAVAVMDW